ncbi:DUF7669 domain-containing protein [Bacillus marinisedimentorum]|uniref:DUF7669 domain-containing protein n=1 Tax=Bacillus marinisedimentorum TaxID=1821260 RepID=UPI0007E0F984|nr:hypothetical protein [Bacillus marinisedimentorum]
MLYKLSGSNNLSEGIMEKVSAGNVNYENDFENWLENSPDALLDEYEGNTIFWIGRQTRAAIGDSGKYPDLMGIDSEGNLVIVELKKGSTPREVVAQALEYSTWASALSETKLNEIFLLYQNGKGQGTAIELRDKFHEVFYPDTQEKSSVEFNRKQRIFIIAETVSPIVREVTDHLRDRYGMEIFCMEYTVYKSSQGEYIISTEQIGSSASVKSSTGRWNEPVKVKELVYDTVRKLTIYDEGDETFTPAAVYREIAKEYPDINPTTVRCQLIADCVNHTSRKHYPSGQKDLYYLVSKGNYRKYDPQRDGEWNWKGEPVNIGASEE